ncbi:hypothetical protein DY000_02055542 [Brassica cretica]|uniref:OCRE domain-containing protein n=2 Tax=Brassica cretica TaxID=69181 RepID=A0ABQ7A7Y5_BRACR|nr:hypothetical protein DY000_02055542 [Brassica cretica]
MSAASIDMTSWPSIDTQLQQRCRKRASTDTAYYKSVDTEVNRVRDGDYPIGSCADEHHHESFAVETVTYTPGADKLQDSFTDEELLNMQRRDETDQIQADVAWERTHEFGIFRDPDGYAKAIDGHTLHVSREDITDILQTANGENNLFMHQRSNPEQKATKESYDTASGIDNGFIQRSRHTTHPSIDVDVSTSVARQPEFDIRAYDLYGNRKFYWEEKDGYGVYRDDKEFARDLDGRTILVHNKDIRRLLALKTTEERLDGRCDDIYFPMVLSISALTSKVEAIQGELVEIQSYIARRPEASLSIDRRNNKSIDILNHTSIDSDTNRGQIVSKMTSDMSNTPYHGEEISADTYAALTRHRFNLESLGERLQRIENTTAAMKDKWRRGDEAMRDFTDSTKDTKVDQPVNYPLLLRLF